MEVSIRRRMPFTSELLPSGIAIDTQVQVCQTLAKKWTTSLIDGYDLRRPWKNWCHPSLGAPQAPQPPGMIGRDPSSPESPHTSKQLFCFCQRSLHCLKVAQECTAARSIMTNPLSFQVKLSSLRRYRRSSLKNAKYDRIEE